MREGSQVSRRCEGEPEDYAAAVLAQARTVRAAISPGGGLQDRIARQWQAYAGTSESPLRTAYQVPGEWPRVPGHPIATGRAAYATTAGNDAYVAGRDQYTIQAAPPAANDPVPARRRHRRWIMLTWGSGD
jgi:hypothetical protein